jgi:hypothetical protein
MNTLVKYVLLSSLMITIVQSAQSAQNESNESNTTTAKPNINTITELSTSPPTTSTPYDDIIFARSVRGILGQNVPIEHGRGQLRAGYITYNEKDSERENAYAVGGHLHLDSKRWYGMQMSFSAYSVLNLGINQNPANLDPDFFYNKGKSFELLTEAYIDGIWGKTEIKLGRQILITPHADSDDLRMLPNYFEAYTIVNHDIENLLLNAGIIREMAGWENSVDSKEFVNIGAVFATQDIDGIYYAGAIYNGIKDLSLKLWLYKYQDIANLIYLDLGYLYTYSDQTTFTLGLQYNGSSQTGAALLGEEDAETYGISVEGEFKNAGITFLAAYNLDRGNTGATDLSLGSGPFFTSMESTTLDAMYAPGSAWVLGAGYTFKHINIDELTLGVAYAQFTSKESAVYKSNELDVVLNYNFDTQSSVIAAFASVDDKLHSEDSFDQLRIIYNHNF